MTYVESELGNADYYLLVDSVHFFWNRVRFILTIATFPPSLNSGPQVLLNLFRRLSNGRRRPRRSASDGDFR